MMQVYLQRSSSSICFGLSKCFYAGHIHATELKRNTAKESHRIQHQPIGITKDDDLRESPQGSSPPSLDVSGNHDFSQPVDNKFKRLQKVDLSFTKQTLTTEMELKLIFRKRHNRDVFSSDVRSVNIRSRNDLFLLIQGNLFHGKN